MISGEGMKVPGGNSVKLRAAGLQYRTGGQGDRGALRTPRMRALKILQERGARARQWAEPKTQGAKELLQQRAPLLFLSAHRCGSGTRLSSAWSFPDAVSGSEYSFRSLFIHEVAVRYSTRTHPETVTARAGPLVCCIRSARARARVSGPAASARSAPCGCGRCACGLLGSEWMRRMMDTGFSAFCVQPHRLIHG